MLNYRRAFPAFHSAFHQFSLRGEEAALLLSDGLNECSKSVTNLIITPTWKLVIGARQTKNCSGKCPAGQAPGSSLLPAQQEGGKHEIQGKDSEWSPSYDASKDTTPLNPCQQPNEEEIQLGGASGKENITWAGETEGAEPSSSPGSRGEPGAGKSLEETPCFQQDE